MDKKEAFVICRVSKELKEALVKKAGGARKLSAYLREQLSKLVK